MEQQLVATRLSATSSSAKRTVALRSHRERSGPADGLRCPGPVAANAGSFNRFTHRLREGHRTRPKFRVGEHAAGLDAALSRGARRGEGSGRKKPAAEPTRPQYSLAVRAIGLVPIACEPC